MSLMLIVALNVIVFLLFSCFGLLVLTLAQFNKQNKYFRTFLHAIEYKLLQRHREPEKIVHFLVCQPDAVQAAPVAWCRS